LESSAARPKIDQALRLVSPARQDNASLKDVFKSAQKELEDYQGSVRAIKFDRPDKDVSAQGTALRGKAERADQQIDEGEPEQMTLEAAAKEMEELIDGALADLGKSNYRASEHLKSARNDLDFARDSTISTTGVSLAVASRILTSDLDPYLAEVEADAPGRDVGRFADDIEKMWQTAGSHLTNGPIYADSTERSLEKIMRHLESARASL
jgi:hypothetical protein